MANHMRALCKRGQPGQRHHTTTTHSKSRQVNLSPHFSYGDKAPGIAEGQGAAEAELSNAGTGLSGEKLPHLIC